MSPLEMQVSFELEINKIDSLDKPLTVDVEYWLNTAQLIFVKTRYSGNNLTHEGFEQSQKRIDDLTPLVTVLTISTSAGTDYKTNTYTALLPADYMFTISEEVSIGYNHPITSTPTLKIQGITECTQDRYRQEIDNPMSQYHFHYLEARPLRLYVGDYVHLISDGNYTIPSYHLNYLRLPTDISILGTPPVAC